MGQLRASAARCTVPHRACQERLCGQKGGARSYMAKPHGVGKAGQDSLPGSKGSGQHAKPHMVDD